MMNIHSDATTYSDARTWNLRVVQPGESAPSYLGDGRRVNEGHEPMVVFYDAAQAKPGSGPGRTGKFDELGQDWGTMTLGEIRDRAARQVGLSFDLGQRVGVSARAVQLLARELEPAMTTVKSEHLDLCGDLGVAIEEAVAHGVDIDVIARGPQGHPTASVTGEYDAVVDLLAVWGYDVDEDDIKLGEVFGR